MPERSPSGAAHLRALDLLVRLGTDRMPHGAGRTLFDHLTGTAAIVASWEHPAATQLAALVHSVYGTSVYRDAAASDDARPAVRAAIGDEAERIAFAFGALDRAAFRSAIASMDRPAACRVRTRWGAALEPDAIDVEALTVIGMANECEQTVARDGARAAWRERCPSLVAAAERWALAAGRVPTASREPERSA
jgi:hypothetical protein